MHFTVFSCNASVTVKNNGSIMIEPGSTFLKKRGDKNHSISCCQFRIKSGGRTGNRFGKVEILYIFYLAEVERVVKFLQYNEFCATLRQVDDALSESGLVIGDVRRNVKL